MTKVITKWIHYSRFIYTIRLVNFHCHLHFFNSQVLYVSIKIEEEGGGIWYGLEKPVHPLAVNITKCRFKHQLSERLN